MTMKKIIYLVFMLVFITSCSEKDMEYNKIDFDKTSFVVFSDAELSVNELVFDPIEVVALYATSSEIGTVSVPFSIVSDAVEGVDYTIVDNKTSFDFSDGNLSDSVFIMPIDNLEAAGDKTLTFSFSSNAMDFGYPGPDSLNATTVLTIVDNDCPYTLAELGAATWSGTDNSGQPENNVSQIVSSYDGTDLYLEGIAYGWLTNPGYWDEVIVDSYPVKLDWDLLTSTFTIEEQPLCTTTWVGSPQPAYSLSATGNYDSCSETMVINFDLIQGGGVLRSYTETITK